MTSSGSMEDEMSEIHLSVLSGANTFVKSCRFFLQNWVYMENAHELAATSATVVTDFKTKPEITSAPDRPIDQSVFDEEPQQHPHEAERINNLFTISLQRGKVKYYINMNNY